MTKMFDALLFEIQQYIFRTNSNNNFSLFHL